jgi:hypothetical protein
MKNSIKLLIKHRFLFLLLFIVTAFYFQFFFNNKIPIPSDTIVGMYYPYKDHIWDGLISGVPYKNPLITDPVRQQYLWKKTVIEDIKNGQLPIWNQYSFSGTPLLANFQSGTFYPLNTVFFLFDFPVAWGFFILSQSLLAAFFMFMYLRLIKISNISALFSSIVFAFSGFVTSWLEWGNIIHTYLWFPIILYSIESILINLKKDDNRLYKLVKIKYKVFFLFSITSAFFSGHLQVFFYIFVTSFIYLIFRSHSLRLNYIKIFKYFIPLYLTFFIISIIQSIPTFYFLIYSARSFDLNSWTKEGWFLPLKHLIQFFAPDYFGNPVTGNYFGVWNYGEFIAYIGILPILIITFYFKVKQDFYKKFFGLSFLISIIFAIQNKISEIPYKINIPFFSTSQPTRILSITTFSLVIIFAVCLDFFLKTVNSNKRKFIFYKNNISIFFLYILLFLTYSFLISYALINELTVSIRNLAIPILLFFSSSLIILFSVKIKKTLIKKILISLLFIILLFDLYRFSLKFNTFSKSEWLYPETDILKRIKEDIGIYRIISLDRNIFPPNFSIAHGLLDVSGYDPLYLKLYGQLISSAERDKPDDTLSSFNRIVNPQNFDNFLFDLLGVKYILSHDYINNEKLSLVNQYGSTYLYKNLNHFPRYYLVNNLIKASDKSQELILMYELQDKLLQVAVSSDDFDLDNNKQMNDWEKVELLYYSNNKIIFKTNTEIQRILVLTDIWYPSWKVKINNVKDKIYRVNYAFRGVLIPEGENIIEFSVELI